MSLCMEQSGGKVEMRVKLSNPYSAFVAELDGRLIKGPTKLDWPRRFFHKVWQGISISRVLVRDRQWLLCNCWTKSLFRIRKDNVKLTLDPGQNAEVSFIPMFWVTGNGQSCCKMFNMSVFWTSRLRASVNLTLFPWITSRGFVQRLHKSHCWPKTSTRLKLIINLAENSLWSIQFRRSLDSTCTWLCNRSTAWCGAFCSHPYFHSTLFYAHGQLSSDRDTTCLPSKVITRLVEVIMTFYNRTFPIIVNFVPNMISILTRSKRDASSVPQNRNRIYRILATSVDLIVPSPLKFIPEAKQYCQSIPKRRIARPKKSQPRKLRPCDH